MHCAFHHDFSCKSHQRISIHSVHCLKGGDMASDKTSLQKNKSDLKKLVSLMNKQNKRYFPPFNPLLKTLDFVLSDDELDLLLKMRTDLYSYEQANALSNMNSEKFQSIFDSLIQKGFIGIK